MDGIINVLKPPGMTSFDVIAVLRRIYDQKKIGHAGTLDPLAAGVLPVFLGRAARLIEYAPVGKKTYTAEFLMGITTDTEDVSGHVLSVGQPQPDRTVWEKSAEQFRGHIMQVPSSYSAIRIDGRRAYDLARHGEKAEIPARPAEIYDLVIEETEIPYLRMTVTCSSGTYVRALGRDLGRTAGCGLTMSFLLRTAVGPFCIERAHTLEEIEKNPAGVLEGPDIILSELPHAGISQADAEDFLAGRPVAAGLADAPAAAVYCGERFLGIAVSVQGCLKPKKVFS